MLEMTYSQRIVPYVRMTQRSKYVDPQAIAYGISLQNLRNAIWEEVVTQRATPIPDRTPFEICVEWAGPKAFKFDIDNMLKAVLDAAQSVMFRSDLWCIKAVATKQRSENLRTYIVIKEATWEPK